MSYDNWKTTDYEGEEANVRSTAEDRLQDLRDERDALERMDAPIPQELRDDIEHLKDFLKY